MQKLTTLDWVGEKLRTSVRAVRKEHECMSFCYESMNEIESKFKEGEILSGLTTMKDGTDMLKDHVWIVYWKKRSTVNIVPLINVGKMEEMKQVVGSLYHQYIL
jgi:hypothetical protein